MAEQSTWVIVEYRDATIGALLCLSGVCHVLGNRPNAILPRRSGDMLMAMAWLALGKAKGATLMVL